MSRKTTHRASSVPIAIYLAAAATLSLHPVAAQADTHQPYVALGPWAKGLVVGPGMVANGHRLWGTSLVGQDLKRAVFDDCDLMGVRLIQCDLSGATFRRAVLKGLYVEDCTFGGNDFTDAVVNGIRYANEAHHDWLPLTEKQLKSTWSYKNKVLDDCKIVSYQTRPLYDFRRFRLHQTAFFGGNLTQCRFDGAYLRNTSFISCDLTQCRFDGAHIRNISFDSCTIDLAQLWRARSFDTRDCVFRDVRFVGKIDFSGKSLWSCSLSGSLSDVNVQGSTISGISAGPWLNQTALTSTKSYAIGNLSRIQLSGCDLSGVDFSRQLLIRTSFRQCNFTGCQLEDAVISEASFDDNCRGLTTSQIQSTWNWKHGRMHGIRLPKEVAAALGSKEGVGN